MPIDMWEHGDPPRPTLGDDFMHTGDLPITTAAEISDLEVGDLIMLVHRTSKAKALMRVTVSDPSVSQFTAVAAGPDDALKIDPDNPPKEIVA